MKHSKTHKNAKQYFENVGVMPMNGENKKTAAVGIYVNTDRADMSLAETVREQLLAQHLKASVFCAPGLSEQEAAETFIKGCDAVLVLGGDGTLLMVSKICARFAVPVMGINMGRLGFLSEAELSETEKAAKALASGNYLIEDRMMLCCRVDGRELYALNEVVLHRSTDERMIRLSVSADGQAVDRFYADGVLAASPTGSTAYNLSAGGPIASPGAQVMLLTPICAHTLRARPYVFAAEERLAISSEGQTVIAIDGAEVSRGRNCGVQVYRAPFRARFIKISHRSFYQRLNSKLNEWSTD